MMIKPPARVGDTGHAKVAEVGGGGGGLQVAGCDWRFLTIIIMTIVMMMVVVRKTCILSRLVRLP